jgi:hypothetical protein
LPVRSCVIDGEAIVCDDSGLAAERARVLVNHRAITAEVLIESNTVMGQPSGQECKQYSCKRDPLFLQARAFA